MRQHITLVACIACFCSFQYNFSVGFLTLYTYIQRNTQFVDTCYETEKLVILHVSKSCTNAFNMFLQYKTIAYIHIIYFKLRVIINVLTYSSLCPLYLQLQTFYIRNMLKRRLAYVNDSNFCRCNFIITN